MLVIDRQGGRCSGGSEAQTKKMRDREHGSKRDLWGKIEKYQISMLKIFATRSAELSAERWDDPMYPLG